jgi:ectoine hydroxylase-related dioxygenase (phytanoyl-CoA dioxygenase family)
MDEASLRAIEADGVTVVPGILTPEECDRLTAALGDAPHAIRNLMEAVPEVARLARLPAVRGLAGAILGPDCFAVRGLFFDKTPQANWKVAWHQDLTIAVRERCEVTGFGPWSEKAGIPHVQPPADLLGRMIAIRLHLDSCGPDNGPLRVVPGSHAAGRIDGSEIAGWRALRGERVVTVDRGGALVMRPLLLHASSPSTNPDHRRVIHLEFAAEGLPGDLKWHGRW